jgi:hypothetical protein
MESGETEGVERVVAQGLLNRCPDMRQKPVGEPAAIAALNFGTPRRRSSLKRLGPFCHWIAEGSTSPVGIGTTAICIDTVPLLFEKLQATRGNLKRVEYACMAGSRVPSISR